MNPKFFRHLVSVSVCVAVVAGMCPAGKIAHAETNRLAFNLGSAFGDRQTLSINIAVPGCIAISVSEYAARTGSKRAKQITLILNGPGKQEAYGRVDGVPGRVVPVWMSVYAPHAGQWTLAVSNFDTAGTAVGSAAVTYPPTRMPCEFRAAFSRDGLVKLTWKGEGTIRVERAAGVRWQALSGCGANMCIDRDVTRGNTYVYRVCHTTADRACTDGEATTPPRAVSVR
jgi:hypothetical protein